MNRLSRISENRLSPRNSLEIGNESGDSKVDALWKLHKPRRSAASTDVAQRQNSAAESTYKQERLASRTRIRSGRSWDASTVTESSKSADIFDQRRRNSASTERENRDGPMSELMNMENDRDNESKSFNSLETHETTLDLTDRYGREQSGRSPTRRESGRSLRALHARPSRMDFIVPLGFTVRCMNQNVWMQCSFFPSR